MKEELVVLNYKNVVYFITKEEYEALMAGELSFTDMFD